MNKQPLSKRLISGSGGVMLFLMCAGGVVLLAANAADATMDGRVLTSEQMTPIFGDGTNPCVKTYSCETGFAEGGDCIRCLVDAPAERKVCCPLGNETNCEYSGGFVCQGLTRMKATVNGPIGGCQTCAGSSWTADGNCMGIANGDGGNCP